MSYKTTKTDFIYFKKCCIYWIDTLHCDDWDWNFEMGDTKEAFATWEVDYDGRSALITLNTKLNEKPTKKRIDRAAFHEVWECGALSTLRAYAMMHVSRAVVEEECHKVMRKLENYVLGYDTE